MIAQNNSKVYSIADKKYRRIYGNLKINTIITCFVPALLIAPFISYYMAVSKGQQHKFPHSTITDTACHYPQDIQFRLFMGGSGSFLSLLYFVLFKWIKSIKQKIKYPHSIYSKLHYISQLSVWGFMIAMGTIDGGWYPDLHTISAVFFFLILFIIVMTKTLVIWDMYQWDTSFISKKSVVIKVILGGYTALVWIYTAINLVLHPDGQNDDQNIYIVILEWNSVYIGLVWVFTFVGEWTQLNVSFSEQKVDKTLENRLK